MSIDPSSSAQKIRTFLIADIRGYTAFTQQRGDEAAAVLAARFAAIVREVVTRGDGEVVELRGDEALCVFDSPRASIRCAVSMQQRFADEIRANPDLPLRVGIGIDAGEAVAVEGGFRGGALNLAARLCSLAKPGEVLVSQGVVLFARQVDDIEYVDQGRVTLKGLREPVQYYRARFDLDMPPPPGEEAGRSRSQVAAIALVIVVLAAVAGLAAVLHHGGASAAVPEVGDNGVAQFDAGGRVVGQASFADPPGGVAIGLGRVWATDPAGDALREIDPTTSRAAGSPIQIGSSPTGVAISGGRVWVVDGGERRVAEYDPRSGKIIRSVAVGNGAGPIVAVTDGVWVVNSADGTAQRIAAGSGQVSAPIPVGSAPSAIAVGQGAVWVTDEADGSLVRIDQRTLQVTRLAVGQTPASVAVGAGAVWVANTIDNTVTQVRLPSLQIEKIPVTAPTTIAFGGDTVWVASRQTSTLTRIDPSTATVAATARTGAPTSSLVTADDRLWATTSSAPSSHRGGTLRIGLNQGLDSIDPAVSFYAPAWQVIANTNDGLVGFRRVGGGAGAVVVPDLAIAIPVPTDNGRTYTFQVRRGIRYSTGGTVKPSDFRSSLERALEVPGGPAGYFLTSIVGAAHCISAPSTCSLKGGVVADDAAGTVTIHLTRPDWSLLDELSLPFADAVPAGTPAPANNRPVPATGPYQVTAYTPDHQLTLTRNPHYRPWSEQAQPEGFPDRMTWYLSLPTARQAAMVAHGSLDVALGDPQNPGLDPVIARLATQFPDQAHIYTRVQIYAFLLDTRKPPFNNVLARRAINFAIDRRKARLALGGPSAGQITCQMLPPNIPGYQPYCPYTKAGSDSGVWTQPDLARARRLVARSGTAGEHVTVSAQAADSSLAGILVSALRALGYDVRLDARGTVRDYNQQVGSAQGVQAGPYPYVDDYPAPSDFLTLQFACDSAVNVSHYCNPALDREMERAGRLESSAPSQAALLWQHIDQQVTDQAPWIPLVNDRRIDYLSAHVSNYQHHPQWGMLTDQLWLR